jgi:tape measure protein
VADDTVKIRILADISSVGPAQRAVKTSLSSIERDHKQHLNRIKELHQRNQNAIQQIAARGVNQINAIKERAYQQDLARMRRLESQAKQSASNIAGSFKAIGGLLAGVAIGAGVGVGTQAVQSAVGFDRIRSTLAGVTGSVDQANRKFAELQKVAQTSIGVTTQSATSLYAQFAVLGTVSDQNVNKAIKAMGKLTTVFDVGDQAAFARNIQQLFDQGFEKADIKEAVGRVPIFNQLLKSAFGTSDPAKLRQLKEAGKLTNDAFVGGLFDAVNNDQRLKGIPETIGSKFDKLRDRVMVALEPLGKQIADAIIPAFDQLLPVVAQFGSVMADVLRNSQNAVRTLTNAVNDLANAFPGVGSAAGQAMSAALNAVGVQVAFTSDLAKNMINPTSGFGGTRAAFDRFLHGGVSSAEREKQRRQAEVNRTGKPDLGAGLFPTTDTYGRSFPLPKIPVPKIPGTTSSGRGAGATRGIDLPSLSASDLVSSQYEGLEFDKDRWKEAAKAYAASQKGGRMFGEFMTRRNEEFKDRFGAGLKKEMEDRAESAKRLAEEMKEATERALQFDNAFQFMRGLQGETDQTAQAFNRLGQSIGDSFGDLKNLLGSLGSAVKTFFQDILGNTLRGIAGSALAPLMGKVPQFAGAGGGGFFSTGGFAGGPGAGGILSGVSQFFGGGGGNVFTYSGQAAQAMSARTSAGEIAKYFGGGVPGTAGKVGLFSGLKASLRSTFSNPLTAGVLGASFGGMLGGKSVLGQGLGMAGGGLISAGIGGLLAGSLSLAVAGPLAAIGVPLLIGSIFAGKAAQRRSDEQEADSYWVAYKDKLIALTRDVRANRVGGDEALAQAAQYRMEAVNGISSVKTESVRRSRLANQIPQADRAWLTPLQEAVRMQQGRRDLAQRLVPEFATGGVVPGGYGMPRMVMAHAGEVILNAQQQMMVGQSALQRAGVPGVSGNGGNGAPGIVVNLTNVIGTKEQSEIIIGGIRHPNVQKPLGQALNRLNRYG